MLLPRLVALKNWWDQNGERKSVRSCPTRFFIAQFEFLEAVSIVVGNQPAGYWLEVSQADRSRQTQPWMAERAYLSLTDRKSILTNFLFFKIKKALSPCRRWIRSIRRAVNRCLWRFKTFCRSIGFLDLNSAFVNLNNGSSAQGFFRGIWTSSAPVV
jgi:hypothetical protein